MPYAEIGLRGNIMRAPLSIRLLRPSGGEDPGRIVAVGSGGYRVVQPFLIFPPLTQDDPLEAYDMLLKEECGSDAQPSTLGLAAAAVVAR